MYVVSGIFDDEWIDDKWLQNHSMEQAEEALTLLSNILTVTCARNIRSYCDYYDSESEKSPIYPLVKSILLPKAEKYIYSRRLCLKSKETNRSLVGDLAILKPHCFKDYYEGVTENGATFEDLEEHVDVLVENSDKCINIKANTMQDYKEYLNCIEALFGKHAATVVKSNKMLLDIDKQSRRISTDSLLYLVESAPWFKKSIEYVKSCPQVNLIF